MKHHFSAGFLIALLAAVAPACAGVPLQGVPSTAAAIYVKLPDGTFAPAAADAGGNITVNGSFSATLSGFTPNGTNGTAIAVTTTTSSQALPGGSTVVNFFNDGTSTAYLRLGVGSATATVADIPIPANSGCVVPVGSNTVAAAITASGTANLRQNGGAGLGSFCYGGGGSSAGGGSNSAASATGSAVPANGSYSAVNVGGTLRGATAVNPSGSVFAQQTDLSSVAGTTMVTGAGAAAAGSPRTTVAQDTTTVAGASPTTTGLFVTGPSAAALATAANQTTANTSLSTIATNTTGAATGTNVTETHGTVAAGTAATKAEAVGGIYNSSPITLTTGQGAALQLDANGYVGVNIKAGSSSGAVAQGSTTSGQSGSLVQGAVTTSAPSYTTAQTSPLSLDPAGNLRVTVTSATGVAQGSTSSGQTVSPIGARTLAAAPTDTTAQTNMPVLDINGNQRVALGATTWGGLTRTTVTAAASTNATNLKASAGQLYHLTGYNNSATLAWVSLYDTSGTPTCGTSIVYQMMIPANSTSGAGAVDDIPSGLTFASGIGYCITTGIAGTGSVAATSYVVNFGYK